MVEQTVHCSKLPFNFMLSLLNYCTKYNHEARKLLCVCFRMRVRDKGKVLPIWLVMIFWLLIIISESRLTVLIEASHYS